MKLNRLGLFHSFSHPLRKEWGQLRPHMCSIGRQAVFLRPAHRCRVRRPPPCPWWQQAFPSLRPIQAANHLNDRKILQCMCVHTKFWLVACSWKRHSLVLSKESQIFKINFVAVFSMTRALGSAPATNYFGLLDCHWHSRRWKFADSRHKGIDMGWNRHT